MNEKEQARLSDVLARGIHPRLLRADAPLLVELERYLSSSLADANDSWLAACAQMSAWVSARLLRYTELGHIDEEYSVRVARAPDAATRQQVILDFARALGADEWQIKGDTKAFGRWFGLDAVTERARRQRAGEERRAMFGIGRLAEMVAELLANSGDHARGFALWTRSGIEDAVLAAAAHTGDARVRSAAYACLVRALVNVDDADLDRMLGEEVHRRLMQMCFRPGSEIAIQSQALALMARISTSVFVAILRQRLVDPPSGDDFWFRRFAVRLMCGHMAALPELAELIPHILSDPSPAVRQALAMELHQVPQQYLLVHLDALACRDPAPEVRAAVLVGLPRLIAVGTAPDILASLWKHVLESETDSFVLRVALKTATEGMAYLPDPARRAWAASLASSINALHETATSLAVRRWAAQARERIWVDSNAVAKGLLVAVRTAVSGLTEGRSARVPALHAILREDPALVGRVLSVMAQDDFGLDVVPGSFGLAPKLRKGDRFGFRFWRALFEFRHPSSDKRQAFAHTIGRVYAGTINAPSGIMSELAQTKVPGEPLFLAEEGGWRPYLPLPDHALSTIDRGHPIRIYTAEGMTELIPPRGPHRRLVAALRLSLRFSEIAPLRNWMAGRGQGPASYLRTLEELGLKVTFAPYSEPDRKTVKDTSVARFFPAVALPILPPDLWRDVQRYFVSGNQNSLKQLGLFLAIVLTWFVGRHLWASARMRRTRAALPLVLGGWGTRGKSGTERIKAGVISALGYSLVSKTTGNEAMFLYGYPFGPVREMFLFRPYDKATIWEQTEIARLATRLKGDVFLWECMGLTPSYVKVLQRHWMQDDISTITNTYPDHEDLQGPAGRNIPEVMTNFIPRNGRLLTTEEQMRPILADACRMLGTSLIGVGWLEAGLLPSDALRRFPYEEHPFNIALVLQLSEDLGVDRDFALKEMADRVVPDLGVLKAYPVSTMRTRRIEFVMGMSANERFGALGNWTRMGFDKQDCYAEPGVFLTAVVNNRADRVPRSRVFADMLVNDVSLDRMVLIGSNLKGMQGYIDECWEAYANSLTLWPSAEHGPPAPPEELLEAGARRLRVAYRDDDVAAALRVMLAGQPGLHDVAALVAMRNTPEALASALTSAGVSEVDMIMSHLASVRQTAQEFAELAAMLASKTDHPAVDAAFRGRMRDWFHRKIVIVDAFYAPGDQIIEVLKNATPPGYFNRVLGVQNIKGTGLDFVYRWQAWETVYEACELADSNDPVRVAEGLRTLLTFQEFGVAAEERVRGSIARLRDLPTLADPAQLDLLEANLDRQMIEVRARMTVTRASGFSAWLVGIAEAVLDAGDAVRRRKKADRIYADMVAERISHERAARELKKLNSRQKGGWLTDDLAAVFAVIARLFGRDAAPKV